ncbi:MAG: GIY-YIG nuclease family protein [Patescibacteria group bacterium]
MEYAWLKFPSQVLYAPETKGVYLLSEWASENSIVYIGKADSLHERLSQHPDPNNRCLNRKSIKYFSYEECSNPDIREKELIRKYNPVCNDLLKD